MIIARKGLLVAPAALLCAVGMASVSKGSVQEPASARIQISDLDLDTQGGQRTLERRIVAAIGEVCPSRGSVVAPRAVSNAARRECVRAVRASVDEQLVARGAGAVTTRE